VEYLFASHYEGPGFKSLGGYLCETRILLWVLSRYIGDPDVILITGFVALQWVLHKASRRQCVSRLDWLDQTALLSQFHTRCRSSFQLHNRQSRRLGGALRRACNLTSFSPCLTSPVDYPFASLQEGPGFKSLGGYLCETGILLLALSRYNLLLTTPLTYMFFASSLTFKSLIMWKT
jgi:hypothetical protein